ncbi:MAG: acyl-CoA thioesterase [Myxococcales bacterium]|nr:acyl-CoA thioesterase [Myxococcales bacterium]
MSDPFRLFLRVRYSECDAQGIVFNARYGEYMDVAACEFSRAVFGGVDGATTGIDWRLVRQVTEWKAPARFDDVLEISVTTARVGTTSFTLRGLFRRRPGGAVLTEIETVYVVVDPASGEKRPVAEHHRAALSRGAPGVTLDFAGVGAPGAVSADEGASPPSQE